MTDGGVRSRDVQFGQFRLDAPTTPGGIGLPHAADQVDQVTIHRRPSNTGARFPAPEPAETRPMPSHDGARLNDDQHPLPVGPALQQQYPQKPVGPLELGSGDGALQHGELVAER